MEYTLSMVFLAETGEKSTISISGVRGDLTDVEAGTLMDVLLANDVFINKNGALVSKHSAKVTERAVTKFEI